MRNLDIVAILTAVLLAFGMFGNIQLVYATFKFKQLQHRNGLLVGIIAGLNFVNLMFEMVNVVTVLIGKSLMERRTCNLIIFMYGFSINVSNISMLFLAIDRLLAVSSPAKYRTIRSSHFIAITLIVGSVYALPFVIFGFVLADNTLVEPCNSASAYGPMLTQIWSYSGIVIAVIVILLSIVNYFIMLNTRKHFAQGDASNYQRQMHVTKSLLVMMIVYGMTMVLATLIVFFIGLLPFSDEVLMEMVPYVGLLVFVNYASQYYILFWRSETYRKIFLKLLGRSQVSPSGTSNVTVRELTTREPKQQHGSNRHHNHE